MKVVGSINMDVVLEVDHAPAAGETVLGSDYRLHPGGKGANQAVAARRVGATVDFVGCLGRDAYGDNLFGHLRGEGLGVEDLRRVERPTGAAFITVERDGQNRIIVAPGANSALTPRHLPEDIGQTDWLLLQLEVPLQTVRAAALRVRRGGGRVVLNAAPATPLEKDLIESVDYLVVNESEAGLMLGVSPPADSEQALAAARRLRRPDSVAVITLGSQGVVWSGPDSEGRLPALSVKVVDTTACGDAFVGVLAWALADGMALLQAMEIANAAGGLTATRAGAQPSLPHREELRRFAGF